MNNRRNFIRQITLFAIASTVMPRITFGNIKAPGIKTEGNDASEHPGKEFNYDDFGIVDLHSHPGQKMYLLNRHLWRKHYPFPGPNLLHMQIDSRQFDKGYYKGLVANHYLPELAITKKSNSLRFFFPFLQRVKFGMVKKLEHGNLSNYDQLLGMMAQLTSQVDITNTIHDAHHTAVRRRPKLHKRIVIATNFEQFTSEIQNGNIPLAHAIEGAHALGRIRPVTAKENEIFHLKYETQLTDNMEIEKTYKYDLRLVGIKRTKKGESGKKIANMDSLENWRTIEAQKQEEVLKNLKDIKNKGVCLMTLAHFFRNDFVTYPVEGISYDEKKFPLMMGTSYDPEVEKHHPLTPFGEKLVWNMFDLGIVVDLTHTNPTARKRVFELNKKFNNEKNAKRPVIFSHSGVQSLFNPSIKYVNYKYYNASDEEIWEIKECNGVIGVIPENFWLVGCDTHLSDVRTSSYRKGIKFMLETIDYIYQQTGSYDNIAIGSDFDGLADDPDDLYTPSQFGNLIHGMSEHGIPFEDIKKITHLNALRVLKDGWVTAKT